jgi:hypothetical protein
MDKDILSSNPWQFKKEKDTIIKKMDKEKGRVKKREFFHSSFCL